MPVLALLESPEKDKTKMQRRLLLVAVCFLGLGAGCDDDEDKVVDAGRGGAGGGAGGAGGGQAGAGGTGGGSAGAGGTARGGADGGAGTGGTGTDGGDAAEVSSEVGETGGDVSGDALGASASVMITASAGGTVAAGGGSLLVPAGALAADRMITLQVRTAAGGDPNRANLASDIFNFGPDGTVFAVPVALTLPLNIDVPAGKQAVVAWLDTAGGQWFPVPSVMEDADKVRGMVSHFTSFAVLLINEGDTCPTATPCGGSLNGTWRYSAACLKADTGETVKCGENQEIQTSIDYALTGTVTIDGGRFTANQMIVLRRSIFYTAACLTDISMGQPVGPCSGIQTELNKQQTGWTCTGTPEQGCSCQLSVNVTQTPMGSVVINGQQVAFNEDGKEPKDPGSFCVQGNNLTVQDAEGSLYTAVRQ
jgi:hypothetical protein